MNTPVPSLHCMYTVKCLSAKVIRNVLFLLEFGNLIGFLSFGWFLILTNWTNLLSSTYHAQETGASGFAEFDHTSFTVY